MRAYLTNLGCKLNQAELEALARRVSADGHEVVGSLEAADLHVINTCTVTHAAARTSRKLARRASRRASGVRTVLTGCYVEGSPEEAAALAGVDLVVPNHDKGNLLERLYESFPEWRPRAAERLPVPYVPLEFGNSRALVKIEDGCNMSCSFCIIPQTRGRQVSRPAGEVVAEVQRLVAAGFREIVLTGVQISSYRQDGLRLVGLLERLLAETAVRRLRLTSIAPWDFDPGLLDLLAGGRLCRHFHLSLQSGSDRVLDAMRRPYDTAAFDRLVDTIRRRAPGIAITTDLIVGFPGETDEDFADGLAFVEAMRFAKIHAFPFSPRAGTPAAELPGRSTAGGRKRRMAAVLAVADHAERAFQLDQLGRRLEVLWETRRAGRWHGTSDNYLKVQTTADEPLARQIATVHIDHIGEAGLEGRLVPRGRASMRRRKSGRSAAALSGRAAGGHG